LERGFQQQSSLAKMNLFIDVTNSCRSPRNTGMQRMTRRIFGELAAQLPLKPICWNRFGSFYHYLGARERDYLTAPFARYKRPVGRPQAPEGPIGELGRMLRRRRIDIAAEISTGDLFFVPEMFSDQRTRKLPELLQGRRGRAVAIFHDAAELRLSLLSDGRARRFRNYLKALAAFDLVICISNESRTDLVEFWSNSGVARQPQTIVENWPVEFDQAERIPLVPERPVILYVSSFTARKNHSLLFAAASQVWDSGLGFDLQLVGSSANRGGGKVRLELRRLQKAGRPLYWLKHVTDRALHQAYRNCYFTVYPSLMEGFGLPIVESLWHGKPCICGGNGAIGESARGGGCLIVDQAKVDALAAGIRRLLTDKKLYARLCDEARVRKFRSWSDYIGKLTGHLGWQHTGPPDSG
jgi:glycosyltransferase involved in cell wall biosynthesis